MASRKPSSSDPQAGDASQAAQVGEGIQEYADVGTLTEPVRVRPILEDEEDETVKAGPSTILTTPTIPQDHPPAYTADADPINEQEVLDRAHPRRHGRDGVVEEEYDLLVDNLGVRCSVLEEALRLKKEDREKKGLSQFGLCLLEAS